MLGGGGGTGGGRLGFSYTSDELHCHQVTVRLAVHRPHFLSSKGLQRPMQAMWSHLSSKAGPQREVSLIRGLWIPRTVNSSPGDLPSVRHKSKCLAKISS
jgi:hypothetical protein